MPLLSQSLDSQDLGKHRAAVAFELEVLAKKVDRFGWDRDRNSAAQDRLFTDWMDALQDYPLSEVKAACVAAVLGNPNKMPNEGHVRAEILKARKDMVARSKLPEVEDYTPRPIVSKERADEIMKAAGFRPRKFGGAE